MLEARDSDLEREWDLLLARVNDDDDGDEMYDALPPEYTPVAQEWREKDRNKALNQTIVHPKET